MSKHPTLKIGTSGVRGIVGESFTPELVTSFSAAFGTYFGPGIVVIGSDTRPSREMVAHSAVAGLLSVGCTPVNIGIVPAPSLQFHIRRIGAAGGIGITASHNPEQWNALKFFGPDGVSVRPGQVKEIADLYHQGQYPRVESSAIPSVFEDRTAIEGHLDAVRNAVNTAAIRDAEFKVAVDCCNAAASSAAPAFLESLGCQVIPIHCDPGRPFPRAPEPIRENISLLCQTVKEIGASAGFALDADADRLALVDEAGRAVGEEHTVALAVRHILGKTPGPVVVNLSTSKMVDDLAAEFGAPVSRTTVGEVHVVEEMILRSAIIGGEGNGGVIYPRVNPCRDSFVGMALVLEMMAETRKALGTLVAENPSYAIVKEKVPCRPREIAAFVRLLRHLHADRELDERDGIKILWPDRWIHVRGSNTEPILRIIAEAEKEEEARRLIAGVTEYLRPVVT